MRISANPTGKHQSYVKHAQSGRRAYDYLKTTRSDSVENIKQDTALAHKEKRKKIKAYKRRWKAEKKRKEALLRQEVAERTGYELPDSITYPPRTGEDSLKWALQVLASTGQYEEIRELYETYDGLDSLTSDTVGVILARRSAQIAERFLPPEVEGLGEPELTGPAQLMMSDMPEDQLPHEQMADLLGKVPDKRLEEAVNSLAKMKSKYLELPDIQAPENGLKKHSMKGTSLADRVVIGGNLMLKSTDPIVTDIDLQLGLRMTKKLVFGLGLIWTESFARDSTGMDTKNAHGYSAFARYDLISNFFAYGEYAQVNNTALFGGQKGEVPVVWQYEYLVGLGSEVSLFKTVKMQIILAYDFNHKHNDLHPRPFVVKVGYQVTKLPFMGRDKSD